MVFRPNLTSKLVATAASQVVQTLASKFDRPIKVLELGCGDGAIGLSLFDSSAVAASIAEYYCSDVQTAAVQIARARYADNGIIEDRDIGHHIRESDLLDSWSDTELRDIDLIINDVSAVADEVAGYFRYFENSVSNAGNDGLDNLRRFLYEAKTRPSLNCSVIFPVLSLSSQSALIALLKEHNVTSQEILSKQWPMDMEVVQANYQELVELKEKGLIDFKEIGGTMVATTAVFTMKLCDRDVN